MAAHARLKNEFTEDEKYHNLMRWPLQSIITKSLDVVSPFCIQVVNQVKSSYILKSDGIYSIVTQASRSFFCRLSSIIKISQIVQDKKVSNNVTKVRKNYNHKARKNNNHKARKDNNYRGAYIYDRKV